jgi:hypothetical protein
MKERTTQSGFLNLRCSIRLAVYAAAACSMLTGALLAFVRPDPPLLQRTLSFAERVAYQRAIEEVYWRHRIWPRERPDPKPSLDAVMSQAQLQYKVADYLRKSQALEVSQHPITAEQLQAEMDRMAQHTKQPEVLRELFEALGNNPWIIAECLARPILAERLTADVSVHHTAEPSQSAHTNAPRSGSIVTTVGEAAYILPRISEGNSPCIPDMWAATSTTNTPAGRGSHTAVWTGTEMIVWGGIANLVTLNDGGRYNPAIDSWAATSATNAPSARVDHTAVWTGSEMIIWGGGTHLEFSPLNTGGRYDPITNSWTATSLANAPSARFHHIAIWTGSEMIIWGGQDGGSNDLNASGRHNPSPDSWMDTGGKYNPTTNTWTATSTTNAPSRRDRHTAVWTGSEMIIWGGYFYDGMVHWLNTGGRYSPAQDSWTRTSTANAPTGRELHTAVWTGNQMVVWGGWNSINGDFNTGGRYSPDTDNWTGTNTNNAPTPRRVPTAVWTGSEMIVWSGSDAHGPQLSIAERYLTQTSSSPPTPTATPTPTPTPSCICPTPTATATPIPIPSPGTGGRYNPVTDTWTHTSTTNAPEARGGHTAVWTGNEMIVWGGSGILGLLTTGGRYCGLVAPTPSPTPTPTPTPCSGRCTPTPRPRPSPHPRS